MRTSIHASSAAVFRPRAHADERTQKLAERLAGEAQAFEKIAPELVGRETLHQRVRVPPPRFKLRVGDAATSPRRRVEGA